ncbi:MAG: DUF3108 domain-containing protein [Candidatus Omnitrophota bacterium]
MRKLTSKKILKITFLICVVIIAALILNKSKFSRSQELFNDFKAKITQIHNSESPFKEDERLLFRVKMGFLTVGRSQLIFKGKTKLDGREVYLIKFITRATNFIDTETIYTDPISFLPLRVQRDIKMFGKKIDIVEEYNQKEKFVKITRTEAGKTDEQIIRSDNNLDSIICLIYLYRIPGKIELGKTMTINLPLKRIKVKVENIRNIRVPAGNFDAFIMKSEPKGYNFWFGTGENRLPLSIDGAIRFGSARLLLEDVN